MGYVVTSDQENNEREEIGYECQETLFEMYIPEYNVLAIKLTKEDFFFFLCPSSLLPLSRIFCLGILFRAPFSYNLSSW